MSLANAFRFIIQMQGTIVTVEDKNETISENIKMAPSNYFRNFQGFEETIFEGHEFVVDKEIITKLGRAPKRGDVIIHPDYGNLTMDTIKPMPIMGETAGYRIRTN